MHFFDTINFNSLNFLALPWMVLVLILLALVFDFLNGFHDAANSVATVVSTRVLSPQAAVIWAAFFNFLAFLVFTLAVAHTMGTGIIHPSIVNNQVIAASLLAACAWDILTWYWGLPTSSSHALIGGMIGAALVEAGWSALVWKGILITAAMIVGAPVLGMAVGLATAVAVNWMCWKATPRGVDSFFRRGQLVSAAFFSLGHGGNDAQKTMGIIFVLLIAATNVNPLPWTNRYHLHEAAFEKLAEEKAVPQPVLQKLRPLQDKGFATQLEFHDAVAARLPAEDMQQHGDQVIAAADNPEVPTEVVLACHLAIGLGTLFGGWRIVKTMGQRIIHLRPVDGFCAETGAAVTLAVSSLMGSPVSTTHTITGAIVGVGALKRLSAVRWGVAGQVVWAWVLTIPGAAVIAVLSMWAIKLVM